MALLALLIAMSAQPTPADLAAQVDAKRLRTTVEKLASFNTRNTLSPILKDSAEWLANEFRSIPGVQATLFEYTLPKGRRVPEDKKVVQVVAWLNGKDAMATSLAELRGRRVVMVGGHMDSLNLQVDAETGRAPGANDDASGVAVALEMARLMAPHAWSQTVVFVGWTGEEQGLHGSRALATFAKENGWDLEAVLSNDTVGSSSNKAGQKNDKQVRVFSDEDETHLARELARVIEWNARKNLKGFGVKLVLRADRFGRGGDHTPFAQAGFNAVRFIEVHEEYTRQHTPDDLPEHMDWAYLANVARTNLVSLALLAQAGPEPKNVRLVRDQSHDTTLEWDAEPGVRYVVYWRDTASASWQGAKEVGSVGKTVLPKINKDDHLFAVGAVGGVPVPAR